MEGIVELSLDAIVPICVRGPRGVETLDAVIDTGFSGRLSLPTPVIRLEWARAGRAALADGTEIRVDIYDAEVEWHNSWREIAVDEADTDPLIGMRLLRGSEVCISVTEGGAVTVLSLSDRG